MTLATFLSHLGVQIKHHLLVHSSYRGIRAAFPDLSIEHLIEQLQQLVSSDGSIIMPAFTYCFKKSIDGYELYDPNSSHSKVGAVSEVFRKWPGVCRTAAPTHSFILWGQAAREIATTNSPESPLGDGSVIDWLTQQSTAHILLLGVNFTSMSFCHFLEVKAPVPWADYSPWDHLHVLKIGVSIFGEQKLKEVPGCSKPFVNFERYLVENKIIQPTDYRTLSAYYFPIRAIYEPGVDYFKTHYPTLLCPSGTCSACDSRRRAFLEKKS